MIELDKLPLGRMACVLMTVLAIYAVENNPRVAVPVMAIFVFAGVALHWIAVWREIKQASPAPSGD